MDRKRLVALKMVHPNAGLQEGVGSGTDRLAGILDAYEVGTGGGRVEMGDIGQTDLGIAGEAGGGIGGPHTVRDIRGSPAGGSEEADERYFDATFAVDHFAVFRNAAAHALDADEEGIAGAQSGRRGRGRRRLGGSAAGKKRGAQGEGGGA